MLNKAFTGFVVVFWLVMMTMLIRVEYFPRETRLLTVPTSIVLDKMFHATDPANLEVIYRGSRMGSFRLDVSPMLSTNEAVADKATRSVEAYVLQGNLLVNLVVFGSPSRMHLRLESLFDKKYDMKNFDLQSEIGDARAQIHGDNATRELEVNYGFNNERQSRRFSYDELGSANVLSSLGLPGLPGLSALGALGMPAASAGGSTGKSSLPLTVHTYFDSLPTANGPIRAYLMEITMENSLNAWAKIWVDEKGGILLVDTSMGLSMRDSQRVESPETTDRTFERAPRK